MVFTEHRGWAFWLAMGRRTSRLASTLPHLVLRVGGRYSTLVWTGMDVMQGHAAQVAPKALAAARTVRPFAFAAAGGQCAAPPPPGCPKLDYPALTHRRVPALLQLPLASRRSLVRSWLAWTLATRTTTGRGWRSDSYRSRSGTRP